MATFPDGPGSKVVTEAYPDHSGRRARSGACASGGVAAQYDQKAVATCPGDCRRTAAVGNPSKGGAARKWCPDGMMILPAS